MDEAFKSALEQLPGLFVVTSASFVETQPYGFEADLNAVLGGRLYIIPAGVTDPLEAADGLRPVLQDALPVDGVVVLGDYTQVPSHAYMSIDPDLCARMREEDKHAEFDPDRWWVWSDDIYGCVGNSLDLPDLPVSRLPFIPQRLGAPFEVIESPAVCGVRSTEFPFAGYVFNTYLALPIGAKGVVAMPVSPPLKLLDEASIVGVVDGSGAKWAYLVLHGRPTGFPFVGGSGVSPVVVTEASVEVLAGPGSVVFGGVCYGALAGNKVARSFVDYPPYPGDPLAARPLVSSAALSMLNRGANAFVGFSGLHHLPHLWTQDLALGTPLHHFFWENMKVGRMKPSQALFMAKAKTIMSLEPENTDSLALAKTLKAVWSATCLGLGW